MPQRRSEVANASHPAVRALVQFFTAMNAWEREVIDRGFKSVADFNRRGKSHLKRLAQIYEQFCEPGAQPNRLTEINWGGDSPDYDPKTERITSVKPGRNRVTVETQMTGKYDLRMRYELVRVDDAWRLRGDRECFDPDVRKWCPCEL